MLLKSAFDASEETALGQTLRSDKVSIAMTFHRVSIGLKEVK